MCVWVISLPDDRIGLRMISSPGNRIGLRMILLPSDRIGLSFLHSKLVLFSTCWNVGPYLYSLEVGIV